MDSVALDFSVMEEEQESRFLGVGINFPDIDGHGFDLLVLILTFLHLY